MKCFLMRTVMKFPLVAIQTRHTYSTTPRFSTFFFVDGEAPTGIVVPYNKRLQTEFPSFHQILGLVVVVYVVCFHLFPLLSSFKNFNGREEHPIVPSTIAAVLVLPGGFLTTGSIEAISNPIQFNSIHFQELGHVLSVG